MKLTRIFILVSLILAPLAFISVQARSADAPLLEVTATIRPTDTRWPTLTTKPTRTPTVTWTPTLTRTPTITRTVTLTRTSTITRAPTAGPTPLNKPDLLYPAQDSVAEVIRPTFDWTDVLSATAYKILVSRYSSFAYPLVNATVTVSNYTPLADLPRNVTLYWRVQVTRPGLGLYASASFTSPNPPYSSALISPALNALVNGYTLINLDWAVSVIPNYPPFDFYYLQVDDNSDFASPFVDFKEYRYSYHAYQITADLEANKTYYWRVCAYNTLGQRSMWRTSRFRTRLPPPMLISPAYLEVPKDLRPLFDWFDEEGATGYGLVVSANPDFSSPVINLSAPESKYAPPLDLPRNKVLYWRARAQGANTSLWSKLSFTSPNPPNPVKLLSPALDAQNVTLTPRLDWSAAVIPTGAQFAYYQLQVAGGNDFSHIFIDTTIDNITQHIYIYTAQNSLDSWTTYHWRIRTFNTAGQSSAWVARFFTTKRILSSPTPTATRTPTPTVTPTATVSPLTQLYTNLPNGFQFYYPEDATLATDAIYGAEIYFSIAPGTNLSEKYMEAQAWDASRPCESPAPSPSTQQRTEIINGLSFFIEEGADAGMNQLHEWVSYSTIREAVCVNLLFILHSVNPGVYETPPPVFDKAAESAVFRRVVETFSWLTPTATPTPTPTVTPTPEQPASAVFCADTRVNTLLTNLQTALQTSDGAALAALVNAWHGVDIRLHARGSGVNFSPTAAESLFASVDSYSWGSAEGTGSASIGAFKDVILPLLLDVFATPTLACNDDSTPAAMGQAWPYPGINFYAVKSPIAFPWRIFMVGVEYVDGQPYLFALIHAQWGP